MPEAIIWDEIPRPIKAQNSHNLKDIRCCICGRKIRRWQKRLALVDILGNRGYAHAKCWRGLADED